jgi:hypothetical protein
LATRFKTVGKNAPRASLKSSNNNCCCKQKPEAPAQSCENRILRFGKPNGLVLSGPTAVRGAAELRQKASPLIKQHLNDEEAKTTITLEVGTAAKRSNPQKE